MKKLSFRSITLALLISLSVSSFGFANDPELKHFNVSGTQHDMLKRSIWDRVWKKGASFFSCVRKLYSRKDLIGRPLGDAVYGVVGFFKKAMSSAHENTFAFLNSAGENWKCKLINGYCMGMSALNRDLNLLLIYDPNESLAKIPKFLNDQEKSDFYEKLIYTAWAEKRPQIVPGFKNLHEFSLDPVISNIFMGAVPKNWGDLAAIPDIALGVLAKSRKLVDDEEMMKQAQSLIEGVDRGYNPLMYLGGVKKAPAPLPPNPTVHSRGIVGSKKPKTILESMADDAAELSDDVTFDRAPTEAEIQDQIDAAKSGLKPGEIRTQSRGLEAMHSIDEVVAGATDAKNTYIHVVQVLTHEKVSDRKWIFTAIDPNGVAPNNVGTLTVDLDAPQKIHWKGASSSIDLNSFGLLPGDREHIDEIVANIAIFAKENPNIFVAPPKPKTTR